MYVADFETTTDPDDCRVWGWGLVEVGTENVTIGNDLDSFMNRLIYDDSIKKVYFHNLKFDGEFILNWLFKNEWEYINERRLINKEFSTLITNMGTWYSLKLQVNRRTINILDSLKVIPLPVSAISKAFGVKALKGEIDYTKQREIGYKINDIEKAYIKNDVLIVEKALEYLRNNGLTKITTASNAMNDYKTMLGKKNFERWFPVLPMDSWLRESYKGGFTYVNPKYQGKKIGSGSVYDVNSLYPYVMYHYPMPYGNPIWFDGKYVDDRHYPLYVIAFVCSFTLKPNKIPMIQLKHTMDFIDTQYLISSDSIEVTLHLTNVDLEMFLDAYDVFNVQYIGGWKFQSSTVLFKDYIDKWIMQKINATIIGNAGLRTICKLMLNSLYGKFGLNPKVQSKYPSFENGFIKYRDHQQEQREPVYIPIATFVTSYARRETLQGASENMDRFLYADTDSLHLIGTDPPKGIEVDDNELGKWKHENNFTRAKFIRAKSYVEEINGKLYVTCSGMPKSCHNEVTFENFEKGLNVNGKLLHKRVKGGVVLEKTDFTIKM